MSDEFMNFLRDKIRLSYEMLEVSSDNAVAASFYQGKYEAYHAVYFELVNERYRFDKKPMLRGM